MDEFDILDRTTVEMLVGRLDNLTAKVNEVAANQRRLEEILLDNDARAHNLALRRHVPVPFRPTRTHPPLENTD